MANERLESAFIFRIPGYFERRTAAAPATARQMTGTIDINNFEDDFAVRMGLLPPQDSFDFLDRRGAFKAAALYP